MLLQPSTKLVYQTLQSRPPLLHVHHLDTYPTLLYFQSLCAASHTQQRCHHSLHLPRYSLAVLLIPVLVHLHEQL
ncbi:hypothetical protein LINPERHAP2_LOCUS14604, partial [Linum perenne]